jgi:Flp pilus assembly protein TadD
MSLLNDALRKKRGERYSNPQDPDPARLKPGSISGKKRQWLVVSSGIALLAVASAVWLYLCSATPATEKSGTGPIGYHGQNDALREEPQAADGQFPSSQPPSTPLVASSDVVAAASAAPAAHAPEIRKVPEVLESSPAIDPSASAMRDGKTRRPVAAVPDTESRSTEERHSPEPNAAGPYIVQEEPRKESDRLFDRACQFHRRNGLDQAIGLYQDVLKAEPDHAQARFNLIAAYLQTGAYTQAYGMAAKLFKENPTNPQIMLNLAVAHIGCGRDMEALALLDEAAKRPEAPLFEISFHKAVAFGHSGRSAEALSCYLQAETLRPDDPGLLFNMAVLYDQRQQYGPAADYYLKYLEHVREKNSEKIKQVRRRIRILQAFGAEEKLKERVRG